MDRLLVWDSKNHNLIISSNSESNQLLQLPPYDKNPIYQQTPFHPLQSNLNYQNLIFSIISSSDLDPTIPFEYLSRFKLLISKVYLPNSSSFDSQLIQSNFHLILQLIHLTAPTRHQSPFGKNWTQFELLQQLIPPKPDRSFVDLISDQAQYSFKSDRSPSQKPSIFSSPIPWRPNALEYQKQEIWLDLLESISVVLDPSGHVLKFLVVGFLDFQSKLSGLPDLSIKLNDPSKITSFGFHKCVRQGVWTSDGRISFIPPDGEFRLMSYRAEMGEERGGAAQTESRVPVRVEARVTVGAKGGSFQLFISASVPLQKLVLRWRLGNLATGILTDQLVCRAPDGRPVALKGAEWDQDRHQVTWSLDPAQAPCCLSGLWAHKSSENQPDRSIAIDFESAPPNVSMTGLRVDAIDVSPDAPVHSHHPHRPPAKSPTVHKGIKTRFVSGVYLVRWE